MVEAVISWFYNLIEHIGNVDGWKTVIPINVNLMLVEVLWYE